MPLVVSVLEGALADIFSYSYYNDAGAPLYVPSLGQTTEADAANAWADALVSYVKDASAAGVPLVPGTLEALQATFATSLAGVFAMTPGNAVAQATSLVAEIGSLWFVPPLAFPNGYVISDVALGQPVAVAALEALGAVPSPTSTHVAFAGIIDVYMKTIVATHPELGVINLL